MKKIKLGANFAVFLMFFGVAALEAFQTQNWLKAGFWLMIGRPYVGCAHAEHGAQHGSHESSTSAPGHIC